MAKIIGDICNHPIETFNDDRISDWANSHPMIWNPGDGNDIVDGTDRNIAIATGLAHHLSQTVHQRDAAAGVPDVEAQGLRNTGLLPLVVPKLYGGLGASWATAMDIVKILAKADSSAAQLYGYHLVLSVLPHLIGTPEEAAYYYHQTAQHNLLWANAINTRDMRLTLEPHGDGFVANGIKSFCTGAVVSDRIICAARQDCNPFPVMFVIPADRPGLTYNHD
ncbi:MAG: acyl-CoA dehydrogenase family protein [Cyanobacteria bacterium P01_A01_bin.135]